ncbi:MAG: nucleotidyltransferase family protein [Bacteroidota bacterium]
MKEKDPKSVGIVLLAAGTASRMGMPKQLLVYEQKPLILHTLDKLMALESPITVVLGARAAMIRPVISEYPVTIVENESWAEGMGGSMQLGLQTHLDKKAVLLAVVDQALLTVTVLKNILRIVDEADQPAAVLGAARYQNDVLGVPAVFGREWYPVMMELPRKAGARKLLRQHESKVTVIDFPDGDFDLDKPQDWEKFRSKTE